MSTEELEARLRTLEAAHADTVERVDALSRALAAAKGRLTKIETLLSRHLSAVLGEVVRPFAEVYARHVPTAEPADGSAPPPSPES